MSRTRPKWVEVVLFAVALVLASCGAKKTVMTGGSVQTQAAMKKSDAVSASLHFVQQVSDQRLYQKNIVGDMSFSIKAGSINQTLPGQLRMRKDEVIRLQVMIPLIQTEVGRAEVVAKQLATLPGVVSAEYVTGPYDVVLRISAETLEALRSDVVPGVQRVSGITRTLTCPIAAAAHP